MPTPEDGRAAMSDCRAQALRCVRCAGLAQARTQVVFGAGDPDAALMFVAGAPDRDEDLRGEPLAGRAAELLFELLGEVGIVAADVYLTNAVKCRPPDNRDPTPVEVDRCQEYLVRQVELVRPLVVCPLGNLATKLLRGDPAGITTTRGQEEVRLIGRRAVRLYPLFHPAAALYQRSSVELLRADVQRLPSLLRLPEPEQPAPEPAAGPEPEPIAGPPPTQLGLF